MPSHIRLSFLSEADGTGIFEEPGEQGAPVGTGRALQGTHRMAFISPVTFLKVFYIFVFPSFSTQERSELGGDDGGSEFLSVCTWSLPCWP